MITLVPVTVEVAQAVVHHARDVPVRHAPDWPAPATLDALRPLADHPEHAQVGTFLICDAGTVVGECGWDGAPGPDGVVEICFGLAPSARGRGVARAAVRQLVRWAAARGATVVRAEVRVGNEPSRRLLLHCGFVLQGERAGHWVLELGSSSLGSSGLGPRGRPPG